MCLDHTAVRFFIARTSNVHCDTPPEVVKARSQLPLWGLAVKRKKKTARIITPTMASPMQTRVLLNPIRLHGLLSSSIRSRFTPFRASIPNQCHRDRVNRPIGKIGRIPFERSTRVSNVHPWRYTRNRKSCSGGSGDRVVRDQVLYSNKCTRSGRYCRIKYIFRGHNASLLSAVAGCESSKKS